MCIAFHTYEGIRFLITHSLAENNNFFLICTKHEDICGCQITRHDAIFDLTGHSSTTTDLFAEKVVEGVCTSVVE